MLDYGGYNNGLLIIYIGSVDGQTNIGGLVGLNDGQVTSGYSSSDVFGISNVGGVIGYSDGIVAYLYYNTSRIEVSSHTNSTLVKPFRAISNVDSSPDVLGIRTNDLYSGIVELSTSHWKFETSTGFYAYYPQLNVFAGSVYPEIKNKSKLSVTVNKFNEGDG